jgi:hypothetical protein
MEIYALLIQLYSPQKNLKKLRQVFDKAMSIRGSIPHRLCRKRSERL